MENSGQPAKKPNVTAQLIERIKNMPLERQSQLLKDLEEGQSREIRQHDRKACLLTVDYTVEDRYYRDFIQDMSNSGMFIRTSQTFSSGQTILMTFMSPDLEKPFKITGEIIRVLPSGIGVKFKIESQVQEAAIKSIVNMIQDGWDAAYQVFSRFYRRDASREIRILNFNRKPGFLVKKLFMVSDGAVVKDEKTYVYTLNAWFNGVAIKEK